MSTGQLPDVSRKEAQTGTTCKRRKRGAPVTVATPSSSPSREHHPQDVTWVCLEVRKPAWSHERAWPGRTSAHEGSTKRLGPSLRTASSELLD